MNWDEIMDVVSANLPADVGVRPVSEIAASAHKAEREQPEFWSTADLRAYVKDMTKDQASAEAALSFIEGFVLRKEHICRNDPARIMLSLIISPCYPDHESNGTRYWHRVLLKELFWRVYDMIVESRNVDRRRHDHRKGYFDRSREAIELCREMGGLT